MNGRNITLRPLIPCVIVATALALTAPTVHADSVAPAPPTEMRALPGAEDILLKWHASPSVITAGYRVYRGDSGGGTFTLISGGSLILDTSYRDKVNAGSYVYHVTAVSDEGEESTAAQSDPAQAGVVKMWFPSVVGAPGSQVRIPIGLPNAQGINPSAIVLWFHYPSDLINTVEDWVDNILGPTWEVVQGVSVEAAPPIVAANKGVVTHLPLGDARMAIAGGVSSLSLTGEGHLVDVILDLRSDTSLGSSGTLSLSNVSMAGTDGISVWGIAVDFSHQANLTADTTHMQGDLNDDGECNEQDVKAALELSVGLLLWQDWMLDVGDMNGDHVIDSGDALMIARLIVGRPINPPPPPKVTESRSALKSDAPVTLSAGNASGRAGQDVEIPIAISDAASLCGADILFTYPEGIEFSHVSPGDLNPDFTLEATSGAGYVRISMAGTGELETGTGSIAYITLHIPSATPAGQLPLRINEAILKGQWGDDFTWYTVIHREDGGLSVVVSQAQDIDNDGDVDAIDVQLVINGALGIAVAGVTDVNGDSHTDALDVQLVINAALGISS